MNVEAVVSMIKDFVKDRLELTISYIGEEATFDFTSWINDIYSDENLIIFSTNDGDFESNLQLEYGCIDNIKVISDSEEEYPVLRIFFTNGNELSLF